MRPMARALGHMTLNAWYSCAMPWRTVGVFDAGRVAEAKAVVVVVMDECVCVNQNTYDR